MRLQKWGGLLTYASPYAVPAGGAVSQVNLTCSIAGQLTVRDGMRPVAFADAAPDECRDLAGYSFGGSAKVLAFTRDGSLHVLEGPDLGSPLPRAFVPDLPYSGRQVNVGYDYRYNEPGDSIPPPPPALCYDGIYGGAPNTTAFPACTEATCASGISDWSGGSPSTTQYPCALQYGVQLCPCP